MTHSSLTELAEHYAKNLFVDFTVHSRTDRTFGTDELAPFNVADILESHATLAESSPDYDGRVIEVNGYVDVIRDDGTEALIPMGQVEAEDIDSAQVCLAAQFHALYAEAHSIMATFAGLDRLKKALAERSAE